MNEVMAPSGARGFLLVALTLTGTAFASRHIKKGTIAVSHAEEGRINPKLSPTSDSHFFKHDYPHDFDPKAPLEKDFDHPYPVVQESNVYDKDYVKDENSDGGEWKAQAEYDHVRTKLERLKEEEKRIYEKKEELESNLKAWKAKQDKLREERQNAKEARKKKVADAQDEIEKAKEGYHPTPANETNATGGVDTSVGVAEATEHVEKELTDIEECKKKLAEAQAKLKKLQQEMKTAEEEEHEAIKAKGLAEKTEAESEKEESEVELTRKGASAAHDGAAKAYKTEKEELEELEQKLEKAQAKLLKFRGSSVDQDGGVYKAKSAALSSTAWLWAVLAVPVALHVAQ